MTPWASSRLPGVTQVLGALDCSWPALTAVAAVADLGSAPSSTVVVETWRAYGLVVFAGLFALLAADPLSYRGVWELVIAHKVASTVTVLVLRPGRGAPGAAEVVVWDGALSVLLVAAYLGCRGWRSWRPPARTIAS